MKKKIIIMAKSSKHSNYCIAGIDIDTGDWVRPVSSNESIEGAVLCNDAIYSNGANVEIFDVVEIDFFKHVPTNAQSENWLYNSNIKWKKLGESSLRNVITLRGEDKCNYVFGNKSYVVEPNMVTGESLVLLRIDNPNIEVEDNIFHSGESKIRFHFRYNGINYRYFRVSDISICSEYMNRNIGEYHLNGEHYVVFSLTGAFQKNGKHYKMLAQLF